MFNSQDDIDAYLDRLLNSDKPTLQRLFDKKLMDVGLTPTAANKLMQMQSRTLKGILNGTQQLVDVRNLLKLASFLQIPLEEVIELFLKSLEKNFPTVGVNSEEIRFIKENFNLAVLRKAGLINNISDFNHIKKRICARLGLKSIFEYRKPNIDIAFSSGLFKAENDLTRAFWISAAQATLSVIDNPFPYDREGLIKAFPKLRWFSMNIERGLIEVAKILFELGITVIYQAPMQTLQLRGATFNHSGKPCIVLTNYHGFYGTLWHALIHELYHVLFDWDEIKAHKYHLTDDSNEQLSVQEREKEANEFARTYLFSKEKMDVISPFLHDVDFVADYAADNHIEKSIIYVLHAFETQATNRNAWPRAKRYSPDIKDCKLPLNMSWEDETRVEVAVPKLAVETYPVSK
ncbi:ImmA/IrrE family metallo-endopeptidase [Larkinella humicola]|uniref:HTH cro/C1-type domain-containing protein n=1 Tax=Larkinella humicola TaxID=2607654 RepID=A0A5N1J8Y9_9BACT|nr:hypothetical protein [Larkinella humicola]KAA9341151.1 hypothetical protein F0P93_30415 [Larkinella humicola]